ncbi:chitobiase/beta-hexosaminidase C-terminal domain-containing protein [Paenibacillus konkukensis]|nr:chitobiase/beta-hexosaminidase C-terminal domain-containing protein [Paenibacillus konkukensis]
MFLLILAGLMTFHANASTSRWTDGNHADTSWFDNYTEFQTYTIDTPAKLAGVAKLVNAGKNANNVQINGFSGKTLEVNQDLDLSAYLWVPIGTEANPFKGTLITAHGATIEISGMKISDNTMYSGFIGYMDGATVGGFHFTETGAISLSSVTSDVYAGTAVGKMVNNSILYDITSNVPVTVDSSNRDTYVGGIVGQGAGTLSNLRNNGAVTASGGNVYAGGVTGSVYGKMVKIWNTGALNATGKADQSVYAGGIVGYSPLSIAMNQDNTIISNSGAVTVAGGSKLYAGGIVGKANGVLNFSAATTNSAAVTINAPAAAGTYVGGLAGSLGTGNADLPFGNTGAVTNNGGTGVHTGGLAGYIEGAFSWKKGYVNNVAVTAMGKDHVYTGGLFGYATGDLALNGAGKNTGAIRVSGALSGQPDEAYTGGLIGYAEQRVLLQDGSPSAYENSGSITVSGGTGVYTGGIVSNRAYARTDATQTSTVETSNVSSVGNLTVSGKTKLYTGGFIGMVGADSPDKQITNVSFASDITVTAAASAPGSTISTGGVVGYFAGGGTVSGASFKRTPAGVVDGVPTYKGGTITSTGGGAGTYAGGIAGYVDGGSIAGANVGNTAGSYTQLVSDGFVGGVAGYLNGSVSHAAVQYAGVTVQTADGFAGGIAGTAQGSISGATVGDAAAAGSDSVQLAAAAGIDRLTAGGIVGRNEGPLAVTDALVTRIALLNEAGRTDYSLGAVAGVLTPEAQLGAAGSPLQVKQMAIEVNADNSQVGGAVGVNRAHQAFLSIEGVTVEIPANGIKFGGAAGVQDTAQGSEAADGFVIKAEDIAVTAAGDHLQIGGLFGQNRSVAPKGLAENVRVTASGTANQVGGIAGNNTGTIAGATAKAHQLEINGEASEAGGIAGRSEAPDGSASPAVISNAWVHAGEGTLIKATGVSDVIGGIAGYAERTEIKDSVVDAALPDYATLSYDGVNTIAGGIAGKIENGSITGDASKTNADNVFIVGSAAAASSYAGGIAGYNDKTRVEKVFSGSVNLVISGPNAVVGGMTGYNLGTDTAVIINNNTDALSLKVTPTAASPIVGGITGINDRRAGDPSAEPGKAVSTIQNSRIVGTILVSAESAVTGGLVGENRSLIANNSISDKISVTSEGNSGIVGGLAGLNTENGILYYTYSNANLSIAGEHTMGGGLAGENRGQVTASYVDIAITGNAHGVAGDSVYLGGLIGRNSGNVDKSYSVSTVTARGSYSIVGGLVGEHAAGAITNSYAAKEVIAGADHSYAGGLLGRITNGTVTTAYSAGKVTAAEGSYAGGFAGRYDNNSKELLYKAYYVKDVDNDINGDLPDFADGSFLWLNAQARLTTILAATLKDRSYFPGLSGWDFNTIWRYGSLDAEYKYPELIRTANDGGETGGGEDVNANINWYVRDKGAITFEVKSEAELAGLAAIVNGTIPGVSQFSFEGRTIKVVKPIHIQSKQWIPIGFNEESAFQGSFDGGDQLIDGLTLTAPANSLYSGLFGVIGQKAKVDRVKLEPLSVTGQQYAGSLAGLNKGAVSHISVKLTGSAAISGSTAGGMIGKNSGTLSELTLSSESGARVEATGTNPIAGGFIGENTVALHPGIVKFTTIGGNVASSAANATIGGLVGKQAGDVSGLSIDTAAQLSASGAGSTAGGLIGQYVSGKADALRLSFTADSKLEAPGAGSILGGLIGQSGADNPIHQAEVAAAADTWVMTGNGTVGGIVGSKEGQGISAFDLDQVKAGQLNLATYDSSENAVLGGIAGKLAHAAVRDAAVSGVLRAAGKSVAAGGIAGQAEDSILYMLDVKSDIHSVSGAGDGIVGGVAGMLSSSDVNKSFDFGKLAPFYQGVYNASVSSGAIQAAGTDNAGDLYVGGIAGRNDTASIYHSVSAAPIAVSGGKTVSAGGTAGFSSGIIVSTAAHNGIAADTSRVYHVGGIVGQAAGGEIHYSNAVSAAGEKIAVASAVTKPGMVPAAHVGGFVGTADNTLFADSFADIPVQVVCDNQDNTIYAGGFAGLLGDLDPAGSGTIKRAYAKGTVDVQGITGAYAGGFAGSADRYGIEGAYAAGSVANAGSDTRTGGFAGIVERAASVKNAYAVQGKVAASGVNYASRSYTGGFAGYNDGVIERAYAGTADVTMNVSGANAFSGALIGYNFRNASVTGSFYLGKLEPIGRSLAAAEAAKADSDLTSSYGFGRWNFDVDASFLSQYGSADIAVQSGRQFVGIVKLYNDADTTYYRLFNRTADAGPALNHLALGADISLEGAAWEPFAAFRGEFDGQGKTIRGLQGTAEDSAAYGFAAENYGTIKNVIFAETNITAGTNTGIVAGINHAGATISGIAISGSVKGADYTGGAAGTNEGTLTNISIPSLSVTGGEYIGGAAGLNKGMLSDIGIQSLNVAGAGYTGGVTGANEGELTKANIQSVNVTGAGYTGGVAGTNEGELTHADIQSANVTGSDYTGGVTGANGNKVAEVNAQAVIVTGASYIGGAAGSNKGTLSNVGIQALTLTGKDNIGGAVGINSGSAEHVSVNGSINAAGGTTGGIAGVNEGNISQAYSRGSIDMTKGAQPAVAGGIAGENRPSGVIGESFSYADLTIAADQATAGGIAGINRGTIVDTYYSGRLAAEGTAVVRAGGIAGYAAAGTIRDSLNDGEIGAAVNGLIIPGKTYFGGIAGLKEEAAAISNTAFNKQMLKSDTAYYSAAGVRTAGAAGEASGLTAKDLVSGSLPLTLSKERWQAVQGFYPQLVAFGDSLASKLSAAAVIPGEKDTIHQIRSEFGLTQDKDVVWSADPKEISIGSASGSLKGAMISSGSAVLKAAVGGESRSFTVNKPAFAFAETAQKPKAVSGSNPFTDKTSVALASDEANGTIYYTLDGSEPDRWSKVYSSPITLYGTTTIKAVTIAEDKEPSEIYSWTWTMREHSRGGGGGGGFALPAQPEPVITAKVGQKSVATDNGTPVTFAVNSKLTLSAPEGQTIYYTTDGTTPTKDSLRYTGELIITRNMTVKMITDQNDQVVTIECLVENAKYELKSDAGQVKYISGYDNDEFRPDATLNRYEITDMLKPLLNMEDVNVANMLSDVSSRKQDDVAFFTSAGIIDGYPDRTFGGDKGLTRAEFVVIMSRVLKLDIQETGEASLSDVSGHWAEKYINAFTKAGYVDGFPDGTFQPDSEMTRAQAVVLINRVIGKEKQDLPAAFSDLPSDHWAYQDIMAAKK